MPQANSLRTSNDALLDLLWSWWSELGVRGWTRRHRDWWIDPEPLMLFTAAHESLDARLREEAIGWCVRYARFLSAGRLRTLARRSERLRLSGQSRLLGEISQHSRLLFTGEASAAGFELRRAPEALDISRPAQTSLRLRALLGVGARAEVLRLLYSSQPGVSLAASELVQLDVGYTKRTVHAALEELELAGVVRLDWRGNQKVYRLSRREELRAICSLTPARQPRWLPLLDALSGLAAMASAPALDVIALRRAARKLDPSVAQAGLPAIPHDVRGDAFAGAFDEWASSLLGELRAGRLPDR